MDQSIFLQLLAQHPSSLRRDYFNHFDGELRTALFKEVLSYTLSEVPAGSTGSLISGYLTAGRLCEIEPCIARPGHYSSSTLPFFCVQGI